MATGATAKPPKAGTTTTAEKAKTTKATKAAKAATVPTPWTQTRRRLFLETLALTSNVAASERAAGVAPGSAYRERRRSAAFRAAWREALRDGYDRLELAMLERAIRGRSSTKRVRKQGDGTTTVETSDRIGMALLTAHRAAVAETRGEAPGTESARERLDRKLAEMHARLGVTGDDA